MLVAAGAAFLVSLSLTFFFVPLVRLVALQQNVMDVPDGAIKVHAQKTPYLGGVAIFAGFITTLSFFLSWQNYIFLFVLGLIALLFVGLADDLFVATPYQKLLGQIVAALFFLRGGFILKQAFLSDGANMIISFLWILTVVNAFNLVDVMDGLATTLALMASLSFLVFAYLFNLPVVMVMLSAFLGSLLAFLWFNKPTAQIYLGDAGAHLIGGFLAIIPFFFNWGHHSPYGFLVPVIVLAIPLFEVASLVVIRTYKGIPFYRGSPDHYCLYLKNKGWSIQRILIFSALASVALFFVAYLVAFGLFAPTPILLLSSFFVALWLFFIFGKAPVALAK